MATSARPIGGQRGFPVRRMDNVELLATAQAAVCPLLVSAPVRLFTNTGAAVVGRGTVVHATSARIKAAQVPGVWC